MHSRASPVLLCFPPHTPYSNILVAAEGPHQHVSTTDPAVWLPPLLLYIFPPPAQFLKTVQAKCDAGDVVVKVYFKPDARSLRLIDQYLRDRGILGQMLDRTRCPNIAPYHVLLDSDKLDKFNAALVVRQYFSNNLYDRLSTRPFLTAIEKKWIVYQLLQALQQSHSLGIVHGDVKSENCMLTSWNWVLLTDFAPFKPAVLPDDDHGLFQYYFDTYATGKEKKKSRCCLAPERFSGRGGNGNPEPKDAAAAMSDGPGSAGAPGGAAGAVVGGGAGSDAAGMGGPGGGVAADPNSSNIFRKVPA